MKSNKRWQFIATTIRWIARVLSILLTLFYGAYIILASLMIIAADEELFPKMALSFLALGLLIIAMLASWRWEIIGSFAIVAAVFAYRTVEQFRLGYELRLSWSSIAALTTATLFIASSALHWWIRRQASNESPPSRTP